MKKIFPLTILSIFALISCKTKMEADLIVHNAVIYSVNDSMSIFEAMAVRNGKIIELSGSDKILGKYDSDKIIDADGKFLYPGFIDPHCHFYGYGLGLQEADLTGTSSFREVLDIVSQHALKHEQGWITGRGWDQNDWEEPSWPDNKPLNELFPDRPVFLVRVDGHAALANDYALELAGINSRSRVQGGEVLLNNGKPTGILIDNAVDLLKNKIPSPDITETSRALLMAQENCFSVGLTSVHDCGLNADVIDRMNELQENDSLKMRVYAMLSPGKDNFEKYMYQGILKTDRLHVASIKLYADGALGSRGARLIEDYSDDPGNKGLYVQSNDQILKLAKLADSCGYQVNTHCIGDGANRDVLNIYGSILKTKNDRRWRIEHAQVIDPDDFQLFSRYSIIPSIQATHATSDMYWADERLGERIKYAYAYKSLLRQNDWLPNGSDFPVENINPLYGFYAATVRKDLEGWPGSGFQPEEALNRIEALKAMTIWAAAAAFEEGEKGSLEPGKMADFVILEKDIMTVPEHDIPAVKVLNTFIAGEEVFTLK